MTSLCVQSSRAGAPSQDHHLEATAPSEAGKIYSQDGPKRGLEIIPEPKWSNTESWESGPLLQSSGDSHHTFSTSSTQQTWALGWRLGREFCQEQEDVVPFSSWEKISSNGEYSREHTCTRGMCTAQVSGTGLGRDTGGTLGTSTPSVPTNSHIQWTAGKFSSFQSVWNVAEGAQTKVGVQTCVPSPPSSFQRSRARNNSRSSPTTMGCWSCTGDMSLCPTAPPDHLPRICVITS